MHGLDNIEDEESPGKKRKQPTVKELFEKKTALTDDDQKDLVALAFADNAWKRIHLHVGVFLHSFSSLVELFACTCLLFYPPFFLLQM